MYIIILAIYLQTNIILISFKPRFRPNTKYLKLSTSRLLEDTAARAVLKDTTSGLHAKLASEACISTGNAGKSIVIKGGKGKQRKIHCQARLVGF